jgi:flavin reductase (DIM6/NTAB) family NADH-FMN oxidoreductase RutF
MAVDSRQFRQALGCFASGVTVVTAVDPRDGKPQGMTASAFCSLSLSPPLVLVCVQKGGQTWDVLDAARAFAVNLLGEAQVELSNRFAGRFPPDQDRFADLDARPAPHSGAPWLPGALAHLDCRLHAVHDGGDHSIFVGEVVATEVPEDRDAALPLLYFAGRYRAVGETL